jgi:prepilin-type N-terminal cleavage/methylation domain-containing protein
MWASRQKYTGFTIVELIIVIVVIGILAAIVTVSYNGAQDRARFDAYRNDLVRINEAITVYYAERGRYPIDAGVGSAPNTNYCITGTTSFMQNTGLAPSYISPMPKVPSNSGGSYYAYCWRGDGVEYKLVRLVPSGTVPSIEQTSDVTMDPNRGWRGWGFWSPGGSAL